jgi:cholesterol transport system auxiliary component
VSAIAPPRPRGAVLLALLALLALAVLPLAGCSFFTRSAPLPQIYVLHTAVAPAAAAGDAGAVVHPAAAASDPAPPAAAPTLRLLRPLPAPGLDTDRIAVLQPGGRLDFYSTGRWGAPVPDVVDDLALAALRASGAWRVVADPRAVFNTEYVLQLAVERFDAEYAVPEAAPTVRVRLQCLLLRRRDGQAVASFAAEGQAPAAANRMGAVIAAFDTAAQGALTSMATQAAQAVQNATPVTSMTR